MKIQSTTALVTGSARGIGQEIAVRLAERGARVVGLDLSEDTQQATRRRVELAGQPYVATVADVGRESDIRALIDYFRAERFEIDILINNAGVSCSGPFDGRPYDAWQRMLEVNLIGPMRLTYELLPLLRMRPCGHIVNIASVAGRYGPRGLAAYSAAKHGLVGLSSSLRAELAGQIGVSWICPVATRTRMSDGYGSTFFAPLIAPGDVARAVIRAIEKNASEVFVPRWQWFTAAFLPTLFPTLARWGDGRYRWSGNWMELRKDLPHDVD